MGEGKEERKRRKRGGGEGGEKGGNFRAGKTKSYNEVAACEGRGGGHWGGHCGLGGNGEGESETET